MIGEPHSVCSVALLCNKELILAFSLHISLALLCRAQYWCTNSVPSVLSVCPSHAGSVYK